MKKHKLTSLKNMNPDLANALRQWARDTGRRIDCPIHLVTDGSLSSYPPVPMGSSWCYRTKGGAIIRHPSAYRRAGYSNMVYHPSTRRLVVGLRWLANRAR